jgi:hypothetical protein
MSDCLTLFEFTEATVYPLAEVQLVHDIIKRGIIWHRFNYSQSYLFIISFHVYASISCSAFLICPSKNGYRAGKRAGAAPQVVGQAQIGLLDLTLPGFALKLFVYLVNHADATGPNGMSKAL